MTEQIQKYFTRLITLVDVVVCAATWWFAWYLRFRADFIFRYYYEALPFETYMAALIGIIPVMLFLYSAMDLYTMNRLKGRRTEIGSIIWANILGFGIFMIVLYMFHQVYWSRRMILLFFALNIICDTAARYGINLFVRRLLKSGKYTRSILLVGYSRAAELYIDRVLANPQWGFKIRGILDDHVEAGTEYKGIKVLGRIENLLYILPEKHLDEIAVTLSLDEYYRLKEIVSSCEKSGVHTKFIPDYDNIIPTKPYTEDILGLPVINIRYVPLTNPFKAFVKRTMDIVGSLVCIIIFSPILLICAIAVKLSSPGPVFFKQERVGLHNRPFIMYKFRSMGEQSEKDEKKGWTVKNDPRVTKVGKFMRKTSLDELPQLFNVLIGNMSLIGPRPERPQFVEKFQEEIPRYNIKHQVRPGMTGWAQVNGWRGDTSIRKRIDFDIYYIENWTLGFDIKILFLTVFRGFVNKNAY